MSLAGDTASQRRFVAIYALAFGGAFVAMIPYVSVLLPLKVGDVADANRVALLSWAALGGAVVASLANILFGILSDRSYRRRGSRRGWIGAGALLLVLAFGALQVSATPAELLLAVALFQIALNMAFGPLTAVMADEVPDAFKGRVAGILGIAQPAGSLAGVLVTLPALGSEPARYALLCVLFTGMLLPFVFGGREGSFRATGEHTPPPGPGGRDLLLAWGARLLVQVAGNALTTYSFFQLEERIARGGVAPGAPAHNWVVGTIVSSTVVAISLTLVAGRVSDALGRRKPFLLASSATMATGMVMLALARTPHIAGLGHMMALTGLSVFLALQAALVMALLPSPTNRGRDLGFQNLANTLPAGIAPAVALPTGVAIKELGSLLVFAAVCAVLGGIFAVLVRGPGVRAGGAAQSPSGRSSQRAARSGLVFPVSRSTM